MAALTQNQQSGQCEANARYWALGGLRSITAGFVIANLRQALHTDLGRLQRACPTVACATIGAAGVRREPPKAPVISLSRQATSLRVCLRAC